MFWKVPNAPETDVVVGIRRRIVQIQRERTRIRTIVPIATAFEGVFFSRIPLAKNARNNSADYPTSRKTVL